MAALPDPKTIAAANLDTTDTEFDPILDAAPLQPQVAKPVAKPTQKPTSEPTSSTHQHTRGNVRRAIALGANRAQIDVTDPDSLEDWIDSETESRTRERENMAREQVWRDYERARHQPAPTAAATPAPEDDYEIPDEELAGVSAAQPKIAKALKNLTKLAKETAELKKQLAARDEVDSLRTSRDLDDAIDDAFESFNRPDLFGEGSFSTLTDKDQKDLRLEIFRAAGVDPKADTPKQAKRKIMTSKTAKHLIVQKAAAKPSVYADAAEEEETPAPSAVPPLRSKAPPGDKRRPTPEEFASAATIPPSPRTKKPAKASMSDRRIAYQAVAEQMNGMPDADKWGDEEAGIPD